ncbi:MAG: arsenate reductase [Candidatus Endobugula sp.]|jgi:arsenate reductase
MTTLFGIKNCDTVKKARRWLDAKKVDYQFHDFRDDGLTEAQVQKWIDTIGLGTLVNKRSTAWKTLSNTEKQQITSHYVYVAAIIVEHPTLIKRPLLENNGEATVGFSEASYNDIFS